MSTFSESEINKKLKERFETFDFIDVKTIEVSHRVKFKRNMPSSEKNIVKNEDLSFLKIKYEMENLKQPPAKSGKPINNIQNGNCCPKMAKLKNSFAGNTQKVNFNPDVFDRLHSEKRELTERRNEEMRKNELIWKREMFRPKISDKAMKITRDADKFHERLYSPSKKNIIMQVSDQNSTLSTNTITEDKPMGVLKRNYSNKSTQYNSTSNLTSSIKRTTSIKRSPKKDDQKPQIYYHKCNQEKKHMNTLEYPNFPFKPTILEKSNQIASRLGSYTERQRRREYSKSKSPDRSLSKSPINKNKSVTTEEYTKICHSIYQRGVNMNLKKQEKVVKIKEEMKMQEPKFPFKPDLNQPNALRRSNSEIIEDFNYRNDSWASYREKSIEKLKKKVNDKECSIHSFKPSINKNIMDDDEDFILKSIEYTNDYVNNRRSFIKSKHLDIEKAENRHCYCGQNKFTVSERQIQNTPLYNYIKKNNSSRSLSEIRSQSPDKVLSQRKQLRTSFYFENEKNNTIYGNKSFEFNQYNNNISDKEFEYALRVLNKNL